MTRVFDHLLLGQVWGLIGFLPTKYSSTLACKISGITHTQNLISSPEICGDVVFKIPSEMSVSTPSCFFSLHIVRSANRDSFSCCFITTATLNIMFK